MQTKRMKWRARQRNRVKVKVEREVEYKIQSSYVLPVGAVANRPFLPVVVDIDCTRFS